MSIVSFVREEFLRSGKVGWEGRREQSGSALDKFGGVGSPTQEWYRVLAALVKDIWAGPGGGYVRAGGIDANWKGIW